MDMTFLRRLAASSPKSAITLAGMGAPPGGTQLCPQNLRVILKISLSFLIIPYHSLSFLIIPYHSLSFLIIPYHSLSFLIIPYHSLSFLIIPYSFPFFSILLSDTKSQAKSETIPFSVHAFSIASSDLISYRSSLQHFDPLEGRQTRNRAQKLPSECRAFQNPGPYEPWEEWKVGNHGKPCRCR